MSKKRAGVLKRLVEKVGKEKPNLEIERKFRLTPENFAEFVENRGSENLKKINILQGWFTYAGIEYRLRRAETDEGPIFTLDRKKNIRGSDNSKEEFEIKISEKIFYKLFKRTHSSVIKDRYKFKDENMGEVVVDVYLESEDIILEREFNNEVEAKEFQSADWCGEEVTGKFSSKKLASWLANDLYSEHKTENQSESVLH